MQVCHGLVLLPTDDGTLPPSCGEVGRRGRLRWFCGMSLRFTYYNITPFML